MRVLLFRSLCDTGGLASWMLTHGEALLRRGVACEFWFCKSSSRLSEFQQLAATTLAPVSGLIGELRTGRYDIIHLVSHDAAAEPIGLVHQHVRIVASNHGNLSEAWTAANCFARTAVSEEQARLDQPFTDLAVETVRNGISTERFAPPFALESGPPIVAWVGRTRAIEQKDFPRFTRIAERLGSRGFRVWVADAHGAAVADLAGQRCGAPKIERWERVRAAAMPEFYRQVAASGGVMLMTSRFEGLPLAPQEGALCGLATIAPRAPGIPEAILEGLTGTLYDSAAPDDVVADLVTNWIADHPAEPAALARRAAAMRPLVSIERMAERYLEMYQRPSQLRFSGSPAEAETDRCGRAILLKRLIRDRRRRALACRDTARGLADVGEWSLAWRALRRGISIWPRVALGRRSSAQVAGTALRILRRRRVGPSVSAGKSA